MPPALPKPPEVARVLRQVTETVRRHAMFQPGTTAVVAVSGGPDSICLLHSLVRLRRLLKIEPICFHFDHGLRPGSDRDAAYVRRQAQQLGVKFLMRAATSRPARGESKEAWARTVRYEALFRAVEDTGSSAAAVGHTADDQAETVLLALVRGGGLDAVRAMEPVAPPVVRPLLETTREQTTSFCRALRLRPRRDPMNEDRAYLRAALRAEVIPALERSVDRNVRATLSRTAALLRADAALLQQLAQEAAEDLLAPAPDGEGRIRVDGLRRTPRALSSRVARKVLLELGVLPQLAHIESLLDLAEARPGAKVSLPGGLLATREREYVRLLRPSPRRAARGSAAAHVTPNEGGS